MPINIGILIKAAYRLGEKEGADELYDINKIIYFAERLKAKAERKQNRQEDQGDLLEFAHRMIIQEALGRRGEPMTAKELIEKLQMLDPNQVISMEYYDHHRLSFSFTEYFGLTEGGVLTNDVQEKWLGLR